MALPSGQLVFWVMLELRHFAFKGSLFWRICPFQRTVAGNRILLSLCSSSKQFLCYLGHSLACRKTPNQPFVLASNSFTSQQPPFQGCKRLALRFWHRCKQMLGFNCAFWNCSKFSSVELLSSLCRREIQKTGTAFYLVHKFYCYGLLLSVD